MPDLSGARAGQPAVEHHPTGIILRREVKAKCWTADYSRSVDASPIRRDLGTYIIPLPFTAEAEACEVVVALRKRTSEPILAIYTNWS